MTFLKNLGLFFVVFLPATGLICMVMGFFGGDAETAPEWQLGWNPVMWIVVTAPWLFPAVVLVPVLHLTGRVAVRWHSWRAARAVVVVASPVLIGGFVLVVWGWQNFVTELGLPTALAALLYGLLLRLPRDQSR